MWRENIPNLRRAVDERDRRAFTAEVLPLVVDDGARVPDMAQDLAAHYEHDVTRLVVVS